MAKHFVMNKHSIMKDTIFACNIICALTSMFLTEVKLGKKSLKTGLRKMIEREIPNVIQGRVRPLVIRNQSGKIVVVSATCLSYKVLPLEVLRCEVVVFAVI